MLRGKMPLQEWADKRYPPQTLLERFNPLWGRWGKTLYASPHIPNALVEARSELVRPKYIQLLLNPA